MSATAKKKNIHNEDSEPVIDLTKGKRGPSRYRGRRIELPLEGVRKFACATQIDLAKKSGIPQGEISKIENRKDLDVISLMTLRKYIEALGGELEVSAVIDGMRIVIKRT